MRFMLTNSSENIIESYSRGTQIQIMATEPNKVIYSMVGVSKFYDKKPVLKDIYLSYFYGAKIGVIGLNGSGKSSLLRILAGVDKEINGETVHLAGLHRRLFWNRNR